MLTCISISLNLSLTQAQWHNCPQNCGYRATHITQIGISLILCQIGSLFDFSLQRQIVPHLMRLMVQLWLLPVGCHTTSCLLHRKFSDAPGIIPAKSSLIIPLGGYNFPKRAFIILESDLHLFYLSLLKRKVLPSDINNPSYCFTNRPGLRRALYETCQVCCDLILRLLWYDTRAALRTES